MLRAQPLEEQVSGLFVPILFQAPHRLRALHGDPPIAPRPGPRIALVLANIPSDACQSGFNTEGTIKEL